MNSPENEAPDPLLRARKHLRRATLEGFEAASALLEAALRASARYPAAPDSLVGEVLGTLDQLIARARQGGEFHLPEALTSPLSQAIDAEIARWEKRSQTDSDARPVLRAFLGLRELLWEFGVRGSETGDAPKERSPGARTTPQAKSNPKRVQRFDIKGFDSDE
jgi:hypothetical protein